LGLPRGTLRGSVLEALRLVGLEDLAERYPRQLSGGQRQRVGIARALAVEPSLLLMDEPFSSVDAITRRGLQQELVRIWEERGCAVLFVTHDVEEAVYLSDRVVLLAGSPARVAREYRVESPRPRRRDDPGLLRLAARITSDLAQFITA
jgi:NitT/TauT family transport system ATP-binding protein